MSKSSRYQLPVLICANLTVEELTKLIYRVLGLNCVKSIVNKGFETEITARLRA